jgi:GntR family transcriptional regulator, transcriptional repressor for pyruvate dehydrogenase complex
VARKDGKGAESNLRKPVDMSSVSVVPPKRLSDEVAEKIRSFIIEQCLAGGTRLPSERSIAEQFGASRPTVSQALRTLSLMGLVEIRRGSGAYVLRQPDINITVSVNPMLELDRNSLSSLADLRLWLETLGVRQTADHVGADGLHLARAALERLRASVGATSAWIAADTIFHSTVVGMSGNPYLASIYESVHTAVISYEYRSWVENDTVPDWLRPDQAAAAIALHEPIVAALEAGDTEAAVLAVRKHDRAMLEHLMGRWSAQRESGG